MPTSPMLSPIDFYRLVRGQIEHEDGLIGQRVSWFITSQSFLFSAFAIVVNGLFSGVQPHDQTTRDLRWLLMRLVPLVGVLTSLLIEMTLLAGFAAMRRLRKVYEDGQPFEDAARLPSIQGSLTLDRIGAAGPLALPVLFFSVWTILLIRATVG